MKYVIKALKTYETEHARCLSLVEEIGGQFRHTSKAEYASQPPSQYRPKLREAQSHYHSKTQNMVSFHFREVESLQKDEVKDFYTWQYIPSVTIWWNFNFQFFFLLKFYFL